MEASLRAWIADHTAPPAGPPAAVVERLERLAEERSFPIVGRTVGALLGWLARSIEARRVLELGSGFGYSALWLADAVGHRGYVILTEGSKDRAREARENLEQAGFADRARMEVGDALDTLDRLDGPFDLIFNDVDKDAYPRVLDPIAERLRVGGLFVSDNMLWEGKVARPDVNDAATEGVRELNRRLAEDPRFDVVLLPIRDGVTVARRREA